MMPYELAKIKKAALLVLSYSSCKIDAVDGTQPTVKRKQFDASQIARQVSGAGNLSMAQFAQELSKYWPKTAAPIDIMYLRECGIRRHIMQ